MRTKPVQMNLVQVSASPTFVIEHTAINFWFREEADGFSITHHHGTAWYTKPCSSSENALKLTQCMGQRVVFACRELPPASPTNNSSIRQCSSFYTRALQRFKSSVIKTMWFSYDTSNKINGQNKFVKKIIICRSDQQNSIIKSFSCWKIKRYLE